jgi:DNA (cytosine-5)-methyltransferase 1
MRYGSVCSGIEAATVAWHPLGWEPQWFSEIAPFPCKVLAHHYPNVPNLGDMTRLFDNETFRDSTIDVLVGGTPCQSFSTAGLRKGLADPRGNLALVYLRIVDEKRPRWVIWENVPGVLSSNGGRDFGSFLGALGQLGYGFAYRVLDAQYFGVPQRRRRVFVVGYIGDWRPPAAVLFERKSNGGYCGPLPEGKAGDTAARSWWDGSQVAPTLRAWDGKHPAMPCNLPAVADAGNLRWLTPVEAERLQGFPDDYTALGSESKRITALGNSMAVPAIRWLGAAVSAALALRSAPSK